MEHVKTKKPIYKKWWFWLIIVVLIGIIGASAGLNGKEDEGSNNSNPSASDITQQENDSEEESAPEEPIIEVNATDLIAAYNENEVSADNEYKDKTLKITGIVSNIGVDVADRAYVMLKDENNEFSVLGVQCYFETEQQDSIASLKEGDTITVTGTCEGKVISVSVKSCELVQ
jgi:hypothetical protein